MIWQSYEQHSAAALDEPMAEQLSDYLENKEALLSKQIIDLVLLVEGIPSLSSSVSLPSLRLSEAVEELSRKIHKVAHLPKVTLTSDQWQVATKQINDGLWQYVEVLEGCVTELFQQLDQIGFEQWTVDLVRTATSIKDELTHRMDDLIWAVRRIEQQLKLYRRVCEEREGKWVAWRKAVFCWQRLLDRSLEPTVRKCNKFLNFRYRKFIDRYTGYLQLYEDAHKQLQRFYSHRVLSSLDLDLQDRYKQLYVLLRVWEQNEKDRVLPRTETVRAVRSFASYEIVFDLFKEYHASIRKAIFDKSRMIKKQFRLLFIDKSVRQPLQDNLTSYRAELLMLNELILKYKKFYLHTDPQAKSWFQRKLGLDSKQGDVKQIKALRSLSHDIKALDILAMNFHSSLESEPSMERRVTPHLQDEVNRYLHEMGQPLASKDLMRRDAKALLNALHSLDEVGAFDSHVVGFTRSTLIKAACEDWKYHVLQEIPLFHFLYETHRHICTEDEDRLHMNRLNKFQHILDQLKGWIDANETLKRAHEIEFDINDIKAYFQDFLAQVQRLEKPPEGLLQDDYNVHPVINASQALLEYLYTFGKFFYGLNLENPEQRMIRKQLLFVDQYFEEIERKFHELV